MITTSLYLQIIKFELEGDIDIADTGICPDDRIEYIDSIDDYPRMFCDCFPQPLYSTNNSAYFLFRSDGDSSGSGFNISYTSGTLEDFDIDPPQPGNEGN